LSGQFYDVIVVGAGPAGSQIACELASAGYSVAVFEEKGAPGIDACCTGIISTECFQSLGLGRDLILNEVRSVRFFFPSGKYLRFQTEKPQAYVINRLILDKLLTSRAESQGARYFFSCPVVDIIPAKDGMRAEALRSGVKQAFGARVVVLANGFKPMLPAKLGLGEIKSFLVGAQAEIEVKGVEEFEVYFGHKVAPGGFAWLVPIPGNRAYVGLLAKGKARIHLQKLLGSLFEQGRVASSEAAIEQKLIPISPLPRSHADRLVVVGDAAGQVKPTTGGGIYFGHIGAKLAAGVLAEALSSGNLTASHLSRYQSEWRARMGREISRGRWARWAYAKLTDRQIEEIFSVLNANGTVDALIKSDVFSFDWHSKLILTVLRHSTAYPLLRVRRLFARGVDL
jgi:digeranylgeranylglycerophospholipid reductase